MEHKAAIERISTSIKIDPETWKKAKIQAIQDDLTVSELLEHAIREYIKKRGKKSE